MLDYVLVLLLIYYARWDPGRERMECDFDFFNMQFTVLHLTHTFYLDTDGFDESLLPVA